MPRIRSISTNEKNDKMIIGTFGCEIYELEAVGGTISEDVEF